MLLPGTHNCRLLRQHTAHAVKNLGLGYFPAEVSVGATTVSNHQHNETIFSDVG
jgi:hypothetical protein